MVDCTVMLAVVNGTAFGRAVEPEVKKTPMILSFDSDSGIGCGCCAPVAGDDDEFVFVVVVSGWDDDDVVVVE